jgi:DNA-binding CsgD family transcriptional regulator
MSNRREHSTHTTGVHRAHPVRRSTSAPCLDRYEPCLDGLFTYCLSVMCEHDAATAALGEALALAERQHGRGRAPGEGSLHRPWLYALTRWVCLRRLARQGHADRALATSPSLSGATATRRRRDLAALAWPEAAGTTPEQREALELSVRHGLPTREVAAALFLSPRTVEHHLAAVFRKRGYRSRADVVRAFAAAAAGRSGD